MNSFNEKDGIFSRLPDITLSGAQIKTIAMLCMTIDHIAAIILSKLTPEMSGFLFPALPWIIFFLRAVGRIAMPLYCFLLVEGFAHTQHLRRYIASMAVFAVLSEIPFNLASTGELFSLYKNNTLFTLLIGLIFMYLDQRILENAASHRQVYILRMAVFTAACLLAQFTFCDYGAVGILLIGALYFPYTAPASRNQLAGVVMALESVQHLCSAALALIPISRYDGTRGNVRHPYFFYAVDPVHFLILVGIAKILGL